MSRKITFITGNSDKFQKLKRLAEELDPTVTIEQVDLDLPEYQCLDIKEVALGKAKYAFEKLKKPLIVDDGGICLEQYNNFPGALSKPVFQGIGCAGIWKLAANNPKAYLQVFVVYIDDVNSYQLFEGICNGVIISPTKDMGNTATYTPIFVPNGYNKTVAELKGSQAEKKYDHRTKAFEAFLKWFNKNKID